VLGRGSKLEKELQLAACLKDGILLKRRRGGGCAVVLDPGNVIVSVTIPVQGLGHNLRYFRLLNFWLIDGLTHLGFSRVYQDGISDLVVDDRKVGGSCIYRTQTLLFYSICLLVDPEIERLERYLKHPPREPAYRKGRSHSQFVIGLNQFAASPGMSALEVERALALQLDVHRIQLT
jgi:lipoate-protein ligase A